LNFDPISSNKVASTALRQGPFLESLVLQMEKTEGTQRVMQELENVRKELVQQKNMQIFVAGNLNKLSDPIDSLADSLLPPTSSLTSLDSDATGMLITDVSSGTVRSKESGRAVVCPLSAIESSFLSLTCQGIGPYENCASLRVAIEYLTALEGDFWVKLRGAGLTYGSSIYNIAESMILYFSLYKCSDIVKAFEASSQIINDYVSSKSKVSLFGLESSKSSLAYAIISKTSTRLGATMNAWAANYCGLQNDYDQWLLSQIAAVTEHDVMQAITTYLVPLFDPQISNLVITCPTNKTEIISNYFQERGWKGLEIVPEDKLYTAFLNEK